MRAYPDCIRKKIFDLWLQGYTYRQISAKCRVSISTISNIVDGQRQKTPDLDELKSLNNWLKKIDTDIYAALREVNIREQLDQLEISPNQFKEYVEICNRLSEQSQTETKTMIQSALYLSELETKHEKSYIILVDEYQKLTTKKDRLIQQNQQLKEQNENEKIELSKIQRKIKEHQQHLKRITSKLQNIHTVPLDVLNELALFIPTFQSLGYNPETIKLLATIKDDLKALGINPKKLEKNLDKKINLETNLKHLQKKVQAKQEEIDILKTKHQNLMNTNKRLETIHGILITKQISIPCKNCNKPIYLPMQLPQFYMHLSQTGGQQILNCRKCGLDICYNPFEILLQIANYLLSSW